MCGGCHRGLDRRPVGVQPPCMRVELTLHSRHGGRFYLGRARAPPMRNGPCRWKALRVEEATSGHAGVGEAALAALAREGPREGVDTAHRKPERETRQERQR
jgi:hypothetical protein